MKRRVAVLISGRGSNLGALIAASQAPDYPAEIALVVANRDDAGGIDLAAERQIPTRVLPHRRYAGDRAAHELAIDGALNDAGIEVVCLAGYMRRLTPLLVGRWRGRMLNIHPSLLPAFPGLDTHARALAAGVKLHGCTVHLVTEDLDSGPILAQGAVPVLAGDNAETLAARVLAVEHILYPSALRLFLTGGPPPAGCSTAALLNPAPLAGANVRA